MGHKEHCCIGPISFWWFFHPILHYLSPQILIFLELFIIEIQILCNWIQHALNAKYVPLKPFWCFFPSQNQQNVKFLPEILIFQELFIIETWNLHHWIQHTLNLNYAPLKPFQCIFPSQNQQNMKYLSVCWTPPDKKFLLKFSFCTGKKCLSQRLENLYHAGFCTHSDPTYMQLKHFNAFVSRQVSLKCEMLCLKFLDFWQGTTYCIELLKCGAVIRFGMPQGALLNMSPLKPFQCVLIPVQNQLGSWNFCHFSGTPPDQKKKN